MWSFITAIVAITASLATATPIRELSLDNQQIQLLDQLTSFNAPEEIIRECIQYTECIKGQYDPLQPSESLEDCNVDQVAPVLKSWVAGKR